MKTKANLRLLQTLVVLATVGLVSPLPAQLTIPGANGSDGALNVTVSTNIDLGLAVTGPWDTNNTSNAGKGVYDPAKWAVVFKYTSVNIANGATVTFKNHASRAPVVWLVSGSVTNAGTVSLDGEFGGQGTARAPAGGPGGFRGGATAYNGLNPSGGFGPGGTLDADGEYGLVGNPRSYGNPRIIPLIGGSGGSGRNNSYNGGGGGGAILIAASGTISLAPSSFINARGATTGNGYDGSGGAIRLIADQIVGDGRIDANGPGSSANVGRTRLEANTFSGGFAVSPVTQVMSPAPVTLWPPADACTVRVVSVFNQPLASDPKASLENAPADVTIDSSNPVTILLETANFPTNGIVNVFIKPRNAAPATHQASLVGGTTNLATWQVQRSFLPGYATIQARAVAN